MSVRQPQLHSQGYPPRPIRLRVHAARRLDAQFRHHSVRELGAFTAAEFLAFVPGDSQQDIELTATIRLLVRHFETLHLLY